MYVPQFRQPPYLFGVHMTLGMAACRRTCSSLRWAILLACAIGLQGRPTSRDRSVGSMSAMTLLFTEPDKVAPASAQADKLPQRAEARAHQDSPTEVVISSDDASYDNVWHGQQSSGGQQSTDKVAEYETADAPTDTASEDLPPSNQDNDGCTACGSGNNCCGEGGTWFGHCPAQRSWEDGNMACKKLLGEDTDLPDTARSTRPDGSGGQEGGWGFGIDGKQLGPDCLAACGQSAGKCFDTVSGNGFCGAPGVWSGSCCKKNATGAEFSWQCGDRGCWDHHCCVEDFYDPTVRDTTHGAPAKKKEKNSRLSKWASVERLTELFHRLPK